MYLDNVQGVPWNIYVNILASVLRVYRWNKYLMLIFPSYFNANVPLWRFEVFFKLPRCHKRVNFWKIVSIFVIWKEIIVYFSTLLLFYFWLLFFQVSTLVFYLMWEVYGKSFSSTFFLWNKVWQKSHKYETNSVRYKNIEKLPFFITLSRLIRFRYFFRNAMSVWKNLSFCSLIEK